MRRDGIDIYRHTARRQEIFEVRIFETVQLLICTWLQVENRRNLLDSGLLRTFSAIQSTWHHLVDTTDL